MKEKLFAVGLLVGLSLAAPATAVPAGVRLRVQNNYLPELPVLVRVEGLAPDGGRDRETWDAEAVLSADGGVTLSTNRIALVNGMGSALVTFSGGADFNLTATVGLVTSTRALHSAAGQPVTKVGGILNGGSGTWSGLINVTSDVIVTNYTLTIESNTLVLVDGVASGTTAADIIVRANGSIQSLGTEVHPVVITCSNSSFASRWGQIRHDSSLPSLYRHTFIHRAGRATGEGHTGQAPAVRPEGSTLTFESCSITDLAQTTNPAGGDYGTPAKVMYAINSTLTFNDCLFQRVRTGPEIQGTALLLTNSHILETRGPDDSDGIYLHDQQVGQTIKLADSVIAFGDDDGIDTLGSVVSVEGCILRGWASTTEDAKAISVFNGTLNAHRCVITDSTVGIAAKAYAATVARVNLTQSTLTANLTNIMAAYKANAPGPIIDFRVTNCVLWGGNSIHSDFAATNFTISFTDTGEPWSGTGNINADPLFVNSAARNLRVLPGSPVINAGNPASPADADGTRADMGYFAFLTNANPLVAFGSTWRYLDNGSDQGTNWQRRLFDDSSWSNGLAQLGYSSAPAELDEATTLNFGPDPNNKFTTYYFRRAFTVLNPAEFTNLVAQLLFDDGGAVYLNGQEIMRVNLPVGAAYNALASGNGENSLATNAVVPPSLLVIGTNVIAAEIHQQTLISSDLSFDFELRGERAVPGNQPPAVAITAPSNGATYNPPASITIGVNATDGDGTVTNVVVYQNGSPLFQTNTGVFSFTVNGVGIGTYSLTASATDNSGATNLSSAVVVYVVAPPTITTNTLVAAGAVWRYLDNGTDQGTNWITPSFNDSLWASGPAQLGYSSNTAELDEATLISFGPDPNNKHITYYFRRAFSVANPGDYTNLIVRLLYDDGAAVYLNGIEIMRVNLAAGAAYNALATASGENSLATNAAISASLLVPGTNVLAVEMHQQAATSSDLSFDLDLRAVTSGLPANQPPAVTITAPANGASYTPPASLAVSVSASDSDGTVTNVILYRDGVPVLLTNAAAFTVNFTGLGVGTYTFTAAAADNLGATNVSTAVVVTVAAPTQFITNTLIAYSNVWKYLDNGTDQGTAWRSNTFNDASWASGQGQLGYGDSDEFTVVSYGPDSANKYVTTYFRRAFSITNAASFTNLAISMIRDDGGVIYLNGVEVFRSPNMPAGAILYNTLTVGTAPPDNTVDATNFPSAPLLLEGTNVIAVEIHQQAVASSDISFDLWLSGVRRAETNARPLVAITNPADGTFFGVPANFTIGAAAFDTDGSITNLAFYSNGVLLGETTNAPFEIAYAPAAGLYALTAVVVDNVGLVTTSAVVSVTVSTNIAPPMVLNQTPAPGNVTSLTNLTVTFSKPVTGVNAADLMVNGLPASSITGSGSNYSFAFPQPAFGAVSITWAAAHGITDLFIPAHAFDTNSVGANWNYTLLDTAAPALATISPLPGSTVAALNSISVTFDEPVSGVGAGDLLINAAAATNVTGAGAGPYVFTFPQPPQGVVNVTWAGGHGIADLSGNAFAAVPWSYALDTNSSGVVVSEIMYHPSTENVLDEWIELHNKGGATVNLNGWRITKGVNFSFTNVALAPGAYLVVAASTSAFAARYPGVSNVVGDWTGTLQNNGERITVEDAAGNTVDTVRYADEGDWATRRRDVLELSHRGWIWFAPHDGLGASVELINPAVTTDSGQNWAASKVTNGTPGTINSVNTNNIAPLILDVAHFPVVPRSTEQPLITARISDEAPAGYTVNLFWRVDSATPPAFTSMAMRDDGLSGDAVANDGLWSARLAAQANNTVIEFYVSATDSGGRNRTWPGPAMAATDGAGPTGQVVNALFQVDDTVYSPTNAQPLYKMIMTENERAELALIPSHSSMQGPNSRMNGTFVSIDGSGIAFCYNAGFRNRGHGSRLNSTYPNYHVDFRSDNRWKGVLGLNLNSQNVHVQHLGSVLARKAGVDGAHSTAVQVRVNNVNRAASGAPMYGAYAANEVQDADYAEAHFPNDPDGNIYRAVRDIAPPDFSYRGTNYAAYTNTWFKENNQSVNDWSDLIEMLSVMGTGNAVPFTTANVRSVIHAEQWLKHLAFMNLVGNAESGLNTGYNDDYFMYAGAIDRRFQLTYWDLDSLVGEGSLAANSSIFTATAANGSGVAFDRFLNWPDFQPIYYKTLYDLLGGPLSQTNFNATVDETLGGYVTAGTIANIKSWMATRRAYVLGILPPITYSNGPVAVVTGVPRSPTPLDTATLAVSAAGADAYQFSLNGAAYSADTPIGTAIVLSGLANGTNTVAVLARGTNGVWQLASAPTVVSWVVNNTWPAVRLNEVLARNTAALNHYGTFPDTIELVNEGAMSIDLGGLRLSNNKDVPGKYTFPYGTVLAPGSNLVVFANNVDGTPGIHLGFSLDADGDSVRLFAAVTNGGVELDFVKFGRQIADFSIGRFGGSGEWRLAQPSFGAGNVAQTPGNERNLRINEWLALSQSQEDFVELYNPNGQPVALGGLYFTDNLLGWPDRNQIEPLTFMAANEFLVFTASGNGNGGAALNFNLASEHGEIGLFAADLSVIDCVIYGPQIPDVAQGLCPNGGSTWTTLGTPTAGAPNSCPVTPPAPVTITLLTISNNWSYLAHTNLDGVNWMTNSHNDTAWPSGIGLLGQYTPTRVQVLPEPIRTVIVTNPALPTFYARAHFTVAPGANYTSLQFRHIVDDGAAFYLNGVEIPGTRFNLAAGVLTNGAITTATASDGAYSAYFSVPSSMLVTGDNVFAVEVHQGSTISSDSALGVELQALIVTNSAALAGVVINEVLANNSTLTEPDGSKPDWVELYNPSTNAVDLGDMSLTDSTTTPRRWVFPGGTILPALGYVKVRCDADLAAATTNTGFGLKANGGAVYLFNRLADGGSLLSAVTYGLQAADFSIGRVPSGSTNWMLTLPNLGANNIAASLGNPLLLKVNEWMANPAPGSEDYFEIYNPNAQPVDVSRFYLTDNLGSLTKHRLPALSFIGVGQDAFQEFKADGNTTAGADHVSFSLSASGEAVAVTHSNLALIDSYVFGPQSSGVSQGRLPDGAAGVVTFPATPTPGKPNFLPVANLVVNEVLAHSDLPLEDAVEFHNIGATNLDISGWYLSDSQNNLFKFRVPTNTVVPAGGYVVFYEYQFNPDPGPNSFSFSSAKGDEVYLAQSTNAGTVTGYRAFATFGASENGVSFGRFHTSVGVDFTAMSARSFGEDMPPDVAQFRLGTGVTNTYPKVGPLVINEIMFQPGGSNDVLEFLELKNVTAAPLPLYDTNNPANTWRVRKGVDFNFPSGVVLPAGGYVVLVSFDPSADPASLMVFQGAYGTNMTLFGPWSGKLSNTGEELELQKPDAPQTIPGPDFGLVPRIVADRVVFGANAPWPVSPAGTGDSLKKTVATLYGNEPLNWSGGAPTPGAPNAPGVADTDGDQMPDDWELQFGLNPNNPADAMQDLDGDGATNLQEFLAGTNPAQFSSVLRITTIESAGVTNAVLGFLAISNRSYMVEFKDTLAAPVWAPLTNVPAAVTNRLILWQTPVPVVSRFYRLSTP